MSGGISAIKGFDYQATVILDILFNHFDNHGSSAKVRPEGIDDIDLSWTEDGTEHRQYVQIKKPTEDCNGKLNPTTWTLLDTVKELFPNTITHLSKNDYSQLWIVGDMFDDKVISLIDASAQAPVICPLIYWRVVHSLIRNEMLAALKVEAPLRKKLLHWKIPLNLSIDPEKAEAKLGAEFRYFANELGVSEVICNQYVARLEELHNCLPNILARIKILATYGSEQEVVQRVYRQLMQRFSLSPTLIENTLFRNLRGFINDISKQIGRSFNQEELEIELRCIWPHMTPVKDFPVLESGHISRRDLVERFTNGWIGKAIEAIGISGSGKTTLATEIAEKSQIIIPDRLVYYLEVRPNISLRDVLVGVAFYLRRQEIYEPFSIAVRNGPTDEDILVELARSYSAIPRNILLLIDLVDGTCSRIFSRDLSIFIRALSSFSFQIVVFGQESTMRDLTPLERNEHKVTRLDIRGFYFEEFVKLVTYYHSNPDRAKLWDIYRQVTVGRASGLFAKLAHSLARSASLQDMVEIAAKPAEDILGHAERLRFALISEGARSAAEKLICFALPFRRKDAEEIFPDENIGLAVSELLTQGLLRYHDKDLFEMHETVRAGLEGMLAICVRRSSHKALADWYNKQNIVTAEIFHLEKAGKLSEAHMQARKLFLRGEEWSTLSAYVIRNELVSAQDIINVIAGPLAVKDSFLLTNLLQELGEPTVVSKLLEIIHEQQQRYFTDYRWGSIIIETILAFDPGQLHNLITFSIDKAANENQMESALNWLKLGMLRKGGTITSHTIEFFNTRPTNIQKMLVGMLLRAKRREVLHVAFRFLISYQQHPNNDRKNQFSYDFSLHIDSLDDAIEFLAAIPCAEVSAMIVSKSALLEPLANLIWPMRTQLRIYCIEILKDNLREEAVIENAIRVLIFLAEPSLSSVCEPLLSRKDNIRQFVTLLPILQPAFFDYYRYESQLFDCNATLEDRFTALSILGAAGLDLGYMYNHLKATETDPERQKGLDFMFLLSSAQQPFPEAIALLETHMAKLNTENSHIIIPVLMKLGELPIPEATTMLTQALSHSNSDIRKSAALVLSRRRSPAALPALIEQYTKEYDEKLAIGLATAIVASGAKSTSALQNRLVSPSIQLWQCILTMRLRDTNSADLLIRTAVNPLMNWQVRRTAIFAAGRLPYHVALKQILPSVMKENSPLTIDHSENLGCHSLITTFLQKNLKILAHFFAKGKVSFIDFFTGIFEDNWNSWVTKQDFPSGTDAAAWLYARLAFHGWPERHDAPELLLNELNIPLLQSAVLRSLRLCGQWELIEQQLATAKDVWIAMKCLTERKRAGHRDAEFTLRLRSLVEISPNKGNALLYRVIDKIKNSKTINPEKKSSTISLCTNPPSVTGITYEEAIHVLSGITSDFNTSLPLVLRNISSSQCEQLIRLANPANDPYSGITTYIPMIKFTPNNYVVAQKQYTSTGSDNSPHMLIRSVIVAANSFGLPIPWLRELMTGPWARDFVKKYLASLGALNNSYRFYEELSKYEDVLILFLCDSTQNEPIRKYIDVRIIPTLMRYISSGTDEIFEGLCMLALQVNTPEIEPVLSGLLYRWSQRFDRKSIVVQNVDNDYLWRGFRRLTEHPHFTNISGWITLLENVLQTSIQWFHAQDIIRVLERDPRSYILIESQLFKAENWEHFYQDEIDRLDDAAERLFVDYKKNN